MSENLEAIYALAMSRAAADGEFAKLMESDLKAALEAVSGEVIEDSDEIEVIRGGYEKRERDEMMRFAMGYGGINAPSEEDLLGCGVFAHVGGGFCAVDACPANLGCQLDMCREDFCGTDGFCGNDIYSDDYYANSMMSMMCMENLCGIDACGGNLGCPLNIDDAIHEAGLDDIVSGNVPLTEDDDN